jgi:hypothetical protein
MCLPKKSDQSRAYKAQAMEIVPATEVRHFAKFVHTFLRKNHFRDQIRTAPCKK